MAEEVQFDLYIESGVGAHIDNATVAWLFGLDYWGVCGQGYDEPSALAALGTAIGQPLATFTIVERIVGDERVFARDLQPATSAELARTLEILRSVRPQTLSLVLSATTAELNWDDPERVLPTWASWRTLAQMAWHIVDTESRYYLPSLGLPALPRGTDLVDELQRSHDHVQQVLSRLPSQHYHKTSRGEEWSTVKLLRRLAWHERSELVTMRRLLARARSALSP
jgi:hypothetical protein